MSASAFYSGDLATLNDAHVAAQDADTRQASALRQYLYQLAAVRAERARTDANERISNRDANVRMDLGTGQIRLGNRSVDVDLEKALARNALDRELSAAEVAMRRHGIDTAAATSAADLASRERLGTRGLGVQERLGLAGNATQRYGYGVNLELGKGDQAVRRDLGMAADQTARDLGFSRLDLDELLGGLTYDASLDRNRTELEGARIRNTGAVDAITATGKFMQPNARLLESIYQNNAVIDDTNTAAEGAAARANMMIPRATNKLGVNNYNGLRFLPGYNSRADYERAVTDPNGDPRLKADVWNEVLSGMSEADRSLLRPGVTNIVPVVRRRMSIPGSAAVPSATDTSAIVVDPVRGMAMDAIRRASAFPDAATRIANIQQEYMRMTGKSLQ